LRISKTEVNIDLNKLSIDILIPILILEIGHPILLSCKYFCFANIKVITNSSANVRINGPGYLNVTYGYYVDTIYIKAKTDGVGLTATLPHGGNLQI
jgi:hypothetical protein